MCEGDLDCRRLAPAWKLVTIVSNSALSFDCCVVPPEAMASYAQELDEIVAALLPLFACQDRLEHVSVKRMRLPRNFGGCDVTPMSLRSPTAFLAQFLAIPSECGQNYRSAVNGNSVACGQAENAWGSRLTRERCRERKTLQAKN